VQPATGTVVREPVWAWALVWTGFPPLGAAAGWLLVSVSGWAADERWLPFRGVFRLLDRYASTPVSIGAVAAGAAVGLGFAYAGHRDKLTVTVDRGGLDLRRGGRSRRVERTAVVAAFTDGRHLVLQDAEGGELVREKSDLAPAGLAAAFREHGYPWRDADPHAADFRLWVEGLPDLPPGADPLLRARAKVLDKPEEAAELRSELARIGLVVRDDKKRQYVRTRRGR
jgi:hypothetical protein